MTFETATPYLEMLDRALEAEHGLVIKMTSESKATALRHRIYQARICDRRNNRMSSEFGSQYDEIIVTKRKGLEEDWEIRIEHQSTALGILSVNEF